MSEQKKQADDDTDKELVFIEDDNQDDNIVEEVDNYIEQQEEMEDEDFLSTGSLISTDLSGGYQLDGRSLFSDSDIDRWSSDDTGYTSD